MTIGFILNGDDLEFQSGAENRLVDILRNNFGLLGTKTGCYTGQCGACSVIFNGEVVKSCLIPAFKVRSSEIITIEGFSQTDEYQDIILGFSEAGLVNCGFCNTAKILAAEALLGRIRDPSREEILSAFNGIKCRCTEPEELVQGVMKAAEYRRKRYH
ncbi:MAG: 2Fe-2S iron-sulfur cluster binding domain-containing protein [Treponema sp.]|jgi:carbon-monoxide dehydrogenase small subunit|nr:2Fe-2S iron-sulfur cluster binding domain-containing protein [Treponema sp.]